MRVTIISFILVVGSILPQISYAQWIQANGQGGARVFAFDTLGSKIFAGTDRGIVCSSDGGATWLSADNGLTPPGQKFIKVNALVCDNGLLLAGTESDPWALASPIFRSTDSGGTWTQTSLPSQCHTVNSMAVLGKYVFVAMSSGSGGLGGGIYRTTDYGRTWTYPDSGLLSDDNLGSIALCTSGASLFAVTVGEGIFRSDDSGTTWVSANSGISDSSRITCLAASGSQLYAGMGTSNLKPIGGLFTSTDLGGTWKRLNLGADTSWFGKDDIISIVTNGPHVIAGSPGGIFLSTDYGGTWIESDTEELRATVYALFELPNVCLAGTDLGMFRSTDRGVSWKSTNCGMESSAALLEVNGKIVSAGDAVDGGSAILESRNGGLTWQSANRGISNPNVLTLGTRGGYLFAGGWSGPDIFRSSDAGASWTKVWGNGSEGTVKGFASDGTNIFATVDQSILRSKDSGTTWEEIYSGADSAISVSSIAVVANRIFAGTYGGLLTSRDGGQSWTRTDLSSSYDDDCQALEIAGTNIFAGYNNSGIWVSSDLGDSWHQSNGGILHPEINCLAKGGRYVFAGAYQQGVYLSTDSGRSWRAVDEGFPFVPNGQFLTTNINCLLAVGDTLYADNLGGDLGGVWKRSISEMVGSSDVTTAPEKPKRLRVFPNPITESVTIAFTSALGGHTEITIQNLLGEEIARIYDGELPAGEHSFKWNASAFAQGMYECTVRSGGRSQAMPILLTR